MNTNILREQVEYYRERACEYDEWWFRQGRYDRGEAHRQQWLTEASELEAVLHAAAPSGDILELACGTGLWTQHLAPVATRLMAVDAAPEAVALNLQRIGSAAVEYIIADLFNWTPPRQFDFVFFSFWLSHVPIEQFSAFWQTVQSALKPGGRVFFVDSLLNQQSTALNHSALHPQGYSERKLNDGRTYRVVKVFYEPARLEELLKQLGWFGRIQRTENYFLYGQVHSAIAP